jgi:hypothetical protein
MENEEIRSSQRLREEDKSLLNHRDTETQRRQKGLSFSVSLWFNRIPLLLHFFLIDLEVYWLNVKSGMTFGAHDHDQLPRCQRGSGRREAV